MFKRREPRTALQNLRELFWPSMGWMRAFKYVKHRMIRLADTTHKIAAGLALGASISFSPLVGTHFIQAALIAYVIRANILASLIGTFVGNPWTFPFIWWAGYELGSYVFGLFGWGDLGAVPDQMTLSVLWEMFKTQPFDIVLPWMLGGYLIGVLIWLPAYFLYYSLIKAARAAKRRARVHTLRKVAREVTGQKT